MLTAIGILGDLLLRSALGYFQVSESFGRFMAVNAVWQLGRAGAVVILFAGHVLTADTAIVLYVAAPFAAFIAAAAMLPRMCLCRRFRIASGLSILFTTASGWSPQ